MILSMILLVAHLLMFSSCHPFILYFLFSLSCLGLLAFFPVDLPNSYTIVSIIGLLIPARATTSLFVGFFLSSHCILIILQIPTSTASSFFLVALLWSGTHLKVLTIHSNSVRIFSLNGCIGVSVGHKAGPIFL